MLRKVLTDAGYTGDIFTNPPLEDNVAATLLIKLFQQGTTDPSQLAEALEAHFGRAPVVIEAKSLQPISRFAMQGITPQGRAVR